MSCPECSKAQDRDRIAFYRWKAADVRMSGCDTHLREIFEVLTCVQATKRAAMENPSKGREGR